MPGLTWLIRGGVGTIGAMTFVRGAAERTMLTGLGVDPGDAVRPGAPGFSSVTGITVIRSGEWLVAREQSAWPRGIREEVLRRLSAGTESVAIHEDTGKGNHKFVHAFDGEFITALTTTVPPSWVGTQPGRLRPLAEELGDGPSGRQPAGLRLRPGRPGRPGDHPAHRGDRLRTVPRPSGPRPPLLKVPDQPADPAPRG